MINLVFLLNLIIVDIKGQVENPGIYQLESGTINDVIQIAGGLTKDGDTSYINLSKAVIDEMVIYIPNQKDQKLQIPICNCPPPIEINCQIPTTTILTTLTTTTVTTTTLAPEKININTASIQELITLYGIGQAIAEKIIAFRTATPFIIIEDIMLVSGIGEATFAQIKDLITV